MILQIFATTHKRQQMLSFLNVKQSPFYFFHFDMIYKSKFLKWKQFQKGKSELKGIIYVKGLSIFILGSDKLLGILIGSICISIKSIFTVCTVGVAWTYRYIRNSQKLDKIGYNSNDVWIQFSSPINGLSLPRKMWRAQA